MPLLLLMLSFRQVNEIRRKKQSLRGSGFGVPGRTLKTNSIRTGAAACLPVTVLPVRYKENALYPAGKEGSHWERSRSIGTGIITCL